MSRRILFCFALFLACFLIVKSSHAQTQPCDPQASSAQNQPQLHERLAMLLQAEDKAMEQFRHTAKDIRCEYPDKELSQSCHDIVEKLKDEARTARTQIAHYRSQNDPQTVELFDIYVTAQSLLSDVEFLSELDEQTGKRYQVPLASAYNSFIKLTGVWFTGEMRNSIQARAQ